MTRLSLVLGLVVCVGALAVSTWSPTAQAEAEAKCGGSGQPNCPMQAWMEKEMEGPEDKGDTKALAVAYEKLAGMAPEPKWNEGETGWAAISKAGADAAKKGDMVAAKAQCKTCHKAWRSKYKDSFRSKPLPK
jgi:hypothetical protein